MIKKFKYFLSFSHKKFRIAHKLSFCIYVLADFTPKFEILSCPSLLDLSHFSFIYTETKRLN